MYTVEETYVALSANRGRYNFNLGSRPPFDFFGKTKSRLISARLQNRGQRRRI